MSGGAASKRQEEQQVEGRRGSKGMSGGAERARKWPQFSFAAPPTGPLLLLLRISIRSLSKKRAVLIKHKFAK